MAKKEKERCQHGQTPVYMQGCFQCVSNAMGALNILQANQITHRELFVLLCHAFPTKEAFVDAVTKAKKEVAEFDAKKGGV